MVYYKLRNVLVTGLSQSGVVNAVRLPMTLANYIAWQSGFSYSKGDLVTYNGVGRAALGDGVSSIKIPSSFYDVSVLIVLDGSVNWGDPNVIS